MDDLCSCGGHGVIKFNGVWYCRKCYEYNYDKELPFEKSYRYLKYKGVFKPFKKTHLGDSKTKLEYTNSPSAIYDKVSIVENGHDLGVVKGDLIACELNDDGTVKKTKTLKKMTKIVVDYDKKKIKSYSKKVVVSGDIVEIYEYSRPVLRGFEGKSKGKGRSCKADEKEKINNRELVLSRARRDVRRFVNSNCKYFYDDSGRFITPKFMTLTFRDEIRDLKTANYEFTKFIQRLNYNVMNSKKAVLKYLVVPEFQNGKNYMKDGVKCSGLDRGVVHYHLIIFNMPYYDVNSIREDIWFNGFIRLNAVYDRKQGCLVTKDGQAIDNVGAYVCKYMTADSCDERLIGNKSFFTSRNLEKSKELIEKELIESVVNNLPASKVVFENTFENEFRSTHYLQYNMKVVNNKRVNKKVVQVVDI